MLTLRTCYWLHKLVATLIVLQKKYSGLIVLCLSEDSQNVTRKVSDPVIEVSYVSIQKCEFEYI